MRDIDPLGGFDNSRATAISSLGQVVGTSLNGSFIWSSSSGMQPLAMDSPDGINAAAIVVGSSYVNGFGFEAYRWTASGGPQNLNSLVDSSATGWVLGNAWAINDSGMIVGSGYDPAGRDQAFLLTPVPEPASLVLTTLALVIGSAATRFKLVRQRVYVGA